MSDGVGFLADLYARFGDAGTSAEVRLQNLQATTVLQGFAS